MGGRGKSQFDHGERGDGKEKRYKTRDCDLVGIHFTERCMVHDQKQKDVMMDVEMFREIPLDVPPGITKFRG